MIIVIDCAVRMRLGERRCEAHIPLLWSFPVTGVSYSEPWGSATNGIVTLCLTRFYLMKYLLMFLLFWMFSYSFEIWINTVGWAPRQFKGFSYTKKKSY